MTVDFDKLRDIFHAAVEQHAPEQWDAYLEQACAGDEELRRQAAVMLKAHVQDKGPLDYKPFGNDDRTGACEHEELTERPGTLIGPYKLLEQIGEGGFGVVFMAEQTQPMRRKVALKVLKPGMDTRQVIARFEAERQALALMDHPNIARVLDGGATASGRPYFVMDLVKGPPITDYCNQAEFTLRERLGLFVAVCSAVQHAHQKGIIHRDIKPSNVLVTMQDATPVVKVIDFGIAKAMGQQLTEKTLFTGFAQLIGTPAYMSPEQADPSGQDVDTRSDIYSLGVLLYELLTGTTPFEGKRLQEAGFDEMRRIIREEDPPRPSTRLSTLAEAATTVAAERRSDPGRSHRFVRGDLDLIVMKALSKARNERYATAKELADDVECFLDDRPIQARPPTWGDRARKWARRHLVLVRSAAALLLLAVVALAVGAGVLRLKNIELAAANEKERQQRQRADINLAAARKAVDDFYLKIAENPKLRSADFHALRKQLVAAAVPFYEEFVKQEQDDPELEYDRAKVFGRLGMIRQEMGEIKEAMASYEQAQALFRRLAESYPDIRKYRWNFARSYHSIGTLFLEMRRFDEAEKVLRPGVEQQKALVKDFPAEAVFLSDLVNGYNNLAYALYESGRPKEGEQVLRDALRSSRELVAKFPRVAEHRQGLSTCLHNLANVLGMSGRQREAADLFRESVKVLKSLADESPGNPEYRQELARSQHNLGDLLRDTGRPKDAEPFFREAVKLFGELAEKFPRVPRYRYELALNHLGLGQTLAALHRPQEAEMEYRQAVTIYQPLVKAYPAAPEYQSELAESLAELALLRRDANELAEARKLLQEAVSYQQTAAKARPKIPGYAKLLSGHYHDLAKILLGGKDHTAASEVADKLPGVQPKNPADAYVAAAVLARCAQLAEQDRTLGEDKRGELVQGYGRRAVILLRDAIARGYKDLKKLKKDDDFTALRMRADFQKLLTELEAEKRPGKTNRPLR
jgi:serine/threonine protein kinase/tetratricopeptide (TPR) repeat protein